MTRKELVRATAEKAGVTIKDTTVMVDAVLDVILDTLAAGESIEIKGFGTFDAFERAAGVARNPKTGVLVDVPARKSAKFRFSPKAKTYIKGE